MFGLTHPSKLVHVAAVLVAAVAATQSNGASRLQQSIKQGSAPTLATLAAPNPMSKKVKTRLYTASRSL